MTEPVAVVIPRQPRGAARSWRRLVTSVRDGGRDAFALGGPWLDPGRAYEIPGGAVILACDRFPGQREIRMLRAAAGGLETVKAWTVRAPLGKRVTDYLARRLPPGSDRFTAVPLEDLPNRWAGRCRHCRNPVAAGEGRIWRDGDRTRVSHRPGQCPPPPPPPERAEPNYHAGACAACGGWVAAYDGAAVLAAPPEPGSDARYQPAHKGPCPPDAPPGPVNRYPGWCSECCEPVGAGEGCWLPRRDGDRFRRLACYPGCRRPAPSFPSWVVRVHGRQVRPREVILARVEAARGGPPVPRDAPGYRDLRGDGTYTGLYGVVLDTARGPCGGLRARVRAATEEEAAPLAAEAVLAALSVTPSPQGYCAMWSAEIIGKRRPWLAELTGWDPRYGYERKFLRGVHAWGGANRSLTRGVLVAWTLRPGRVYEAWRPVRLDRHDRAYLRATPDGDVARITREEAETWLALPRHDGN